MAKNSPRICANCDHWKRHDVDYGDFPEDECGLCKKYGNTVYGDEEAFDCKGFKPSKRARVKSADYYM